MDILFNNKKLLRGGILHCFEGNLDNVKDVLNLGFYLGIGGMITFASRENLRSVVKEIPLDKIVLETDCPYLAPAPFRGEVNQPKFVPVIAQKIADIKQIGVEEVEIITTKNAKEVYGLWKK